jgi:hypothetical protein
MKPEARNWMMKWAVMGRPKLLPIKMFATMPEEFVDSLNWFDVVSAHGEKGTTYEFDFSDSTVGTILRVQRWVGRQHRGEKRGSFFEVVDQIREWTYAELTRQGRDNRV